MADSQDTLVLVTGGSGYIGSFCVLHLLKAGYYVRTTIREPEQSGLVKSMLREGGATPAQIESVQFQCANLTADEGWNEACEGCLYVHHVASPVPDGKPMEDDEFVVPAVDGTLRVLHAAKASGTVRRVIFTGSIAAMMYGKGYKSHTYDEQDWTDVDSIVEPVLGYTRSKTLAERAAWDWIRDHGSGLEFTSINPCMTFGPLLDRDTSTSIDILTRILAGAIAMPQWAMCIVDVRDVADLHILAMTDPKAAGERYVCTSGEDAFYMKQIAQALKDNLPANESRKVSTWTVPDFVVRTAALFDGQLAVMVGELGKYRNFTSAKAKEAFNWKPRPANEAITAAAKGIRKFGVVVV